MNTMVKWSQSEQEDAIKKMKEDPDMLYGDKFDLNNWIQHGGTYQDTTSSTIEQVPRRRTFPKNISAGSLWR